MKLRVISFLLFSSFVARFAFAENPFVGTSAAILEVEALLPTIAASNAGVVLTGETGVGKDVYARRIHDMSARAGKPFVAVNCGAIAENLAGVLFFGAKKGAYTDARQDVKGLLEEANGGTLFLDELGEMPLAVQTLLLRALEHRKYLRVGDTVERPFDVRVIAGTNKDLVEARKGKEFRDDIFYRLSVVTIPIPPLRKRTSDLPGLIAHLMKEMHEAGTIASVKTYSPAAMEKLISHPWPGNIRELRNVIEYSVLLSGSNHEIESGFLPLSVLDHGGSTNQTPATVSPLEAMVTASGGVTRTVHEMNRIYCLVALRQYGNAQTAAKAVGLSVKTFRQRVAEAEKMGLEGPANE